MIRNLASRKGKAIGLALGMVMATQNAMAATSDEIIAGLNTNNLALSKTRLSKLKDFYQKRSMQPVWQGVQMSVFSRASLAQLLDDHGLDIAKYTSKIDANCPADIATAGTLTGNCELALSEAMVRVADHLSNGQMDPGSVDFENIKMPKKTNTTNQALSDVLSNNPSEMMNFLEQQAPQNFMYQRHKQALRKFNNLKAQGSAWKTFSSLKTRLSLGVKNPTVVTIKNIMAAHGYPINDFSDTFTADLDAAIRDLQVATLLDVTGAVTPSSTTLFSQFFGIDLDRRISRLKLDMEKIRWMPNQLEGSFIFVGLGEQQLTWFDSGSAGGIKLQMKTINGRTERKTPMMRDTITSVILNPPWTVPPGILAKDKLPMFQKQTYWEMQDYFAKNYYTLVDMNNSRLIDPMAVNWSMVTAQNINFYIRQQPGLHNALGVFKFNLTNPYAIYLHDTNQRELFSTAQRLLSSGCVRLEKPQVLAEELLRGSSWDSFKISSTIAQFPGQVPNTTTIGLKSRVPVYLMYMTSSVKEDNIVRFHPDYYGMNAKMLTKLDQIKNDI